MLNFFEKLTHWAPLIFLLLIKYVSIYPILLVLLTVNAGYFSPEEETPFIEHYHGGQHEQQDRLDYFTIRVRRKYLVEETGGNMKYRSDYNISSGFVVQPVHQ